MATAIGRPSRYSPEVADEICHRLSEGELLKAVTADEHIPHRHTIADWIMSPPKGAESFPARFARARELGCDAMVEDALIVARNGREDRYIDAEGVERVNHEHIARSKLWCEQVRWTASKIYRRQYGEDGLFAGLAASGAKVSVTIENVGAPAVEAAAGPVFDAEPEE